MTKEQAYDEKINPLMAQIIEICNEHKIPVLASFTLDVDEGLQCTTALLEDDYEPGEKLLGAFRVLFPPQSPMMLTVRNGDGKATSSTAIFP